MLLAIEKTAIEQDRWVVCGRRHAGRLPQRPIADAMADYRRHIGSNEVLWLIETVLAAPKARERPWGSTRAPQSGPGSHNCYDCTTP